MGFEPTTTCLGSKDSTTELRPLAGDLIQEHRVSVQPEVEAEFFETSINPSLLSTLHGGKLSSADLEPILFACDNCECGTGVTLFLSVDFDSTLND